MENNICGQWLLEITLVLFLIAVAFVQIKLNSKLLSGNANYEQVLWSSSSPITRLITLRMEQWIGVVGQWTHYQLETPPAQHGILIMRLDC